MLNFVGMATDVDFLEFACKGAASASISVDKTTANPGETINVTVTLRNLNYSLTNVDSYLDISFAPENLTIGTATGDGWTGNITTYAVGDSILHWDSNGMRTEIPATQYLISGKRSGSFHPASSYSFSFPITISAEAQPFALQLKYRGTIGDSRNPECRGTGTLDQQGLNVEIKGISIGGSGGVTIPSGWGTSTNVATYQLFGSTFKICSYLDGQYKAILDAYDNVVTNKDLINAVLIYHHTQQSSILAGTDNSSLANKWISETDESGSLTRTCADYYTNLTLKSQQEMEAWWNARYAVAATNKGLNLVALVSGAAVGALLVSNPIGWVVLGVGVLAGGGQVAYNFYKEDLKINTTRLGDAYTGEEYRSYVAANEYLKRLESGIYDDEIFDYLQELAETDPAAAETVTARNNIVSWLNLSYPVTSSLISGADPIPSMFIKSAILVASKPLHDYLNSLELPLDLGYWRARSELKHQTILELLARHIAKTYQTIDREKNNAGSYNTLTREIDKLYSAISFFYSNLLEWDTSEKIRNYQLTNLANLNKDDKYSINIEAFIKFDSVLCPDSLQRSKQLG